ncbi:MAG TPA: 4Fe-4S dicluster domain-containing protein [Symbiobacteriaceae bacterium]|nr:4Fe-4S dicluster domain-containing protein [Symbiobacteriaceae bacterium]
MATERKPRVFTVAVNTAYCKGCEICVQVCPKNVLGMSERLKAEVLRIADCSGCLNCEIYCPDFAINVEEVEANA